MKNRRVFICATGPSVTDQNLSRLSGETIFSCSNFFLHPQIDYINPKFQFITEWHEPINFDYFVGWLSQLDTVLPASTNLVFPASQASLFNWGEIIKSGRRVFLINYINKWYDGKIDLAEGIFAPPTIPLMALPVALAMGYHEIYLIGCDHNILKNYNESWVSNFYEPSRDPRKANANFGKNIIEALKYELNMFQCYDSYKRLIQVHYPNVRIINLSPSSWLDLFEYRPFDAAIDNICD